jgi:hypothetical protein
MPYQKYASNSRMRFMKLQENSMHVLIVSQKSLILLSDLAPSRWYLMQTPNSFEVVPIGESNIFGLMKIYFYCCFINQLRIIVNRVRKGSNCSPKTVRNEQELFFWQSKNARLWSKIGNMNMYYNAPIVYRDHSPFWESFTWKFVESTSDNLGSVVDFTNIMKILSKYQ